MLVSNEKNMNVVDGDKTKLDITNKLTVYQETYNPSTWGGTM